MNIKNILITLALLSSINLFCMDTPIILDVDYTCLSNLQFEILVNKQVQEGKVNIIDQNNYSALHFAASRGLIKIAKLLIDNGVDLNIQDNSQKTALITAIFSSSTSIAKLLIDNGANLNIKDSMGWTALSWAISMHKIEFVKLLIKAGVDLNIISLNWSPLHWAVKVFDIEIIKLLIDAGANLNIQDKVHGYTGLILAAKKDFMNIVELLIEANVDTTLRDNNNKTFLDYIEDKSKKAKIEALIKQKKEPIHKELYKYISVPPLCNIITDYLF